MRLCRAVVRVTLVFTWAVPWFLVVRMTVRPQHGLVEQKEKHQSRQQHGKQLVRTGLTFESFGQQVQDGRGDERARHQARHVLCADRQHGKTRTAGHTRPARASMAPTRIVHKVMWFCAMHQPNAPPGAAPVTKKGR